MSIFTEIILVTPGVLGFRYASTIRYRDQNSSTYYEKLHTDMWKPTVVCQSVPRLRQAHNRIAAVRSIGGITSLILMRLYAIITGFRGFSRSATCGLARPLIVAFRTKDPGTRKYENGLDPIAPHPSGNQLVGGQILLLRFQYHDIGHWKCYDRKLSV